MSVLAGVVGPLPELIARDRGEAVKLPWACHNATLAWLYEAEFGKAVTGTEFVQWFFGAQLIMADIAQHGVKVATPSGGSSLVLPPGAVIVFVRNGTAGHSCVARTADTLGGCNQVGWFRKPGKDHAYSEHAVAELRFKGRGTVEGAGGHDYALSAVPETVARRMVKAIVTKG